MPLTVDQAWQQAVNLYSGAHLNTRTAFQGNPTWTAKAKDQISKAQFDINWYSPSCAGNTAPPLNLLQTSGGLALGTAAAGATLLKSTGVLTGLAVPVVGGVIAGAALLVSFISAIFQHHANAVRRDLAFGCSALPAVNNAFQVIFAAVNNGAATPQAASQALDQVYTAFMQQGGAQSPTSIPSGGTAINDSPYCNGNCEMSVIVKAMVLYWQSQLAAIPASPQAPSAPAGYSPTPPNAVRLPVAPGSPFLAPAPAPAPTALAFVAPSSPPPAAATPSAAASVAQGAGNGVLWAIAAIVLVVLLIPHLGK